MPWTRRQVRYLESSGSPLTASQKDKMNAELHADPSLGHNKKGSSVMTKPPFHRTEITHHDDGSHTVEHIPHMKAAGKSGAFTDRGAPTSYSAPDGEALMGKLHEHLKLDGPEEELEEHEVKA